MNKLLLLAVFIPSVSFAVNIPMTEGDQSKLEYILRRIPSAAVKTENLSGFVRKHTQFPKSASNFVITCYGDFYNSSPIPSNEVCELELSDVKPTYEEYKLTATGAVAKTLYEAIPYSNKVKKLYAWDRVYGQALSGKYRDLFRYTFICETSESCVMTFTAKPSED
jgi:hypothetical protein